MYKNTLTYQTILVGGKIKGNNHNKHNGVRFLHRRRRNSRKAASRSLYVKDLPFHLIWVPPINKTQSAFSTHTHTFVQFKIILHFTFHTHTHKS